MPSDEHEERRRLLDSMAMLSGYSREYPGPLPDGARPDVLRFDPSCGAVFIGEAKDSESPGSWQTLSRLARYMGCVRVLVARDRRAATLAVCFGDRADLSRWTGTLSLLAEEAGITAFVVEAAQLGDDVFVAWVRVPRGR